MLVLRKIDKIDYIVASHLTWGSVITVAVGRLNGGLGDCGLPTLQGVPITMKRPLTIIA